MLCTTIRCHLTAFLSFVIGVMSRQMNQRQVEWSIDCCTAEGLSAIARSASTYVLVGVAVAIMCSVQVLFAFLGQFLEPVC